MTAGATGKLMSAIHMGMGSKPSSTERPSKGITSAAMESLPARSITVVKSYFISVSSLCGVHLLFDGSHMRCSSAARISSSRKSGCAMEMSASARSHVLLPASSAMPYSVTTV